MISTGSRELDEFLNPRHPGLHRDDLMVVAGPPKSGKSFFLHRIISQALASGQTVAVFDFEGSLLRRWEQQAHPRLSWMDTTLPPFEPRANLVVFDGLFLSSSSDSWMEAFRGPGGRDSTKIVSAQSARTGTFLPRRLDHLADYVLRAELDPHHSLVVNVTKNRVGPNGRSFTLSPPWLVPIPPPPPAPTIWERLLSDSVV